MVEPYMHLEEKLTTHFDNLASIESHSSCLAVKEFHQRRDDFGGGMLWKYNKYTPWRDSRRRIIKNVQILSF